MQPYEFTQPYSAPEVAEEEPRGLLARWRARRAKPKMLLLSGKPVRFEFVQNMAWGLVVAGTLGACLIAGWYWGPLQQHWYVHLGSFNHGSSAKAWWDGGMGIIKSKAWYLYRHGYRDLGEPAAAVMFGKTLMASSKYWEVRVKTWRLVTTPLLVIVLAVAMITGGVWVLHFGGPWAWAHVMSAIGRPGYNWDGAFSWAGKLSLGNFVLGLLVIGPVLHKIWAPVGATIQGYAIDYAVDRAQGGNIRKRTYTPLWVKFPLMAPKVRLRFSKQFRENQAIEVRGTHKRLAAAVIVIVVVSVIVGGLAKFAVPHGVHIWYMNP